MPLLRVSPRQKENPCCRPTGREPGLVSGQMPPTRHTSRRGQFEVRRNSNPGGGPPPSPECIRSGTSVPIIPSEVQHHRGPEGARRSGTPPHRASGARAGRSAVPRAFSRHPQEHPLAPLARAAPRRARASAGGRRSPPQLAQSPGRRRPVPRPARCRAGPGPAPYFGAANCCTPSASTRSPLRFHTMRRALTGAPVFESLIVTGPPMLASA